MLERKWWTLIVVCTAAFMLLLDITIVNVALPDIQRELGADFTELQWVIDAYALMLATVVLAAGSLADLVGRKRVFVTGLVVFTLASLLCGMASGPLFLILARAVQGIGGATMFATALALLAQEFRGRDRGTAFGVWGATIGGAVAIGPLIGGALTEGLGWRWIFFVNLPIGVLAVVLAVTRLAESRDPEGRSVDWAGFLLLSGSLFLLVFSLLRGNAEGWGSARIVAQLIGAAALGILFLVVERVQPRPMLDLSLFRKPAFTGVQTAAFAISASQFAMFLYLTLYLQNVLGYSPLEAGLRFLPTTLCSFVFAFLGGQLSARAPARIQLALGLSLVGTGLLIQHLAVTVHSGWTALLPGFVVGGIGIGITNPSISSTAVGVVERTRSGMASGVNNTFRQVGIATGIAMLGAVFQHELERRLGGGPAVQAVAAGGVSAPGARAAFVESLETLFLVASIIAFAGAALSLGLVRGRDFVPAGAPAPA